MKSNLKFCLLAMALALIPQYTHAEVTSVVINSSGSIGEFDGIPYIQGTGSLHGSVTRNDGTSGVYSVPLMIQYPENPSDCNGFGIGEPLHQAAGQASLSVIGTDYIFGNGYVHAAVGWDNSLGAGLSQGNTQKLSDAHQVIKDLMSLLRNPTPFLEGPCPADRIIGFGTSRTGALWREFLRLGNHVPDLIDGILLNTAGALRLDLSGTARAFSIYPGPLPEDVKILAMNTEHDVERYQGWLVRTDTPSYRVYEIAGVPHIPITTLNLAPLGATRQNPVYHGPVAKAMLSHLHDWISNDVEPPPSVTMPGTVIDTPLDDLVPFSGCAHTPTTRCPMYQFIRDEFGNATGGVRLPFMEVPIGTYTGVETNLAAVVGPVNRGLVSQGGTFTPFGISLLEELYPRSGSYVKMIAHAAGTARDHGWILGEDVGAYTSESAHEHLGKPIRD